MGGYCREKCRNKRKGLEVRHLRCACRRCRVPTPGELKGFGFGLIIIEEAALVSEYIIKDVVLPCLSLAQWAYRPPAFFGLYNDNKRFRLDPGTENDNNAGKLL
jgi:hypothetical protein